MEVVHQLLLQSVNQATIYEVLVDDVPLQKKKICTWLGGEITTTENMLEYVMGAEDLMNFSWGPAEQQQYLVLIGTIDMVINILKECLKILLWHFLAVNDDDIYNSLANLFGDFVLIDQVRTDIDKPAD